VETKKAKSLPVLHFWILVSALLVLIGIAPSIIARGYVGYSNSLIKDEITRTEKSRVLLLGSWNDYYSIEYNHYWRQEMGEKFVQKSYDEVLNAASYGDDLFNRYLNSSRFTHVLVPRESFDNEVIRHKFGTRGTIEIHLSNPYFAQVGSIDGPFAAVLLKVLNPKNLNDHFVPPSYNLSWKNVEPSFYTLNKKTEEIGLYRLLYSSFYESGPDVSWFYSPESDSNNFLEIGVKNLPLSLEKIILKVTFVAAYGPNAPSHTISVKTRLHFEQRTLKPSIPETIEVLLQKGDTIKIQNISPCHLPRSFEPTDLDNRKICFGVSKVFIHL